MKNKDKPIYEAPKIMRLDDSDSVFGGDAPADWCVAGSNASGNCESVGHIAVDDCFCGNDAGEKIC